MPFKLVNRSQFSSSVNLYRTGPDLSPDSAAPAFESTEETADPDFMAGRTVLISGVGLIGGSIGLALKAAGKVKTVVGLGRSEARLQAAIDAGAIDQATTDWHSAMSRADVVVLCGPVSTIAEQAITAWAHRSSEKILITDAGSTKSKIIEDLRQTPGLFSAFVGGHPIAGSERSGVEAARVDLFLNRACVLTPTAETCPARLATARAFWRSLGCRLVEMPPEEHDLALARTSHLPHVLAAVLARMVPEADHAVTAGAFRDMTRIAAADADLWRDIFLSNHDSLEKALDESLADLLKFREMLRNESSAEIVEWWSKARRLRLAWEANLGPAGPSVAAQTEQKACQGQPIVTPRHNSTH